MNKHTFLINYENILTNYDTAHSGVVFVNLDQILYAFIALNNSLNVGRLPYISTPVR